MSTETESAVARAREALSAAQRAHDANVAAAERARKAGRMKLVNIAGRLERIGPDPEYALKRQTRAGFARGAKVLRALDAFCDGMKASERHTFRSGSVVALADALRKAVRES